uniref:Putative ovule protein n=1 Tax=Solanum chacoense TaxID=4108 RepID=A0A0V0HPU0_SOLCH
MQNVTRFTIEKAPWDANDISVPYPTGFHPHSEKELREWQNFALSYNRTSLFTFIGAARGDIDSDFRSRLMSYCRNESDSCQVVDCAVIPCSNGSSEIQKALLSSDFCLQPKGDSLTRRSVFDCMVAGSVPVFFWRRTAYTQYQWFLPEDPGSYSVFIDPEAVRNGTASIKEILKSYSKDQVRKMREKVIETIPRIVYARPSGGLGSVKDAFEIAIEGVLKRVKDENEWKEYVDMGS